MEFILEITDSREPKPEKRYLRLQERGLGILASFMGQWYSQPPKEAHAFSVSGGGHSAAKWHFNPNEKRVYVKEHGREILYLDLDIVELPLFDNGRRGTGEMFQERVAIKDGPIKWRCTNTWA